MDFSFTEEQKALCRLVKEFCIREVDTKRLRDLGEIPVRSEMTREELGTRVPWELISKAHDIGIRQITVPKEYGGGGYGGNGNWVTLAAIGETLGYYGGEMGRLLGIPWKINSTLSKAPKAVQDEYFTDFMKDRKTFVGTAISEPDHGGDFFLPYDEPGVAGKYFGYRDGDDWILNGDKMYSAASGLSNYIELAVRTKQDGPISESMTLFLFPTRTSGYSSRVNDFTVNELLANVRQTFNNCRIDKHYMISKENAGFQHMRSDFGSLCIYISIRLGGTQKTWEEMRDYSMERIQGNRPIIQHPNVGALVGEGDCLIRTLKNLLYRFAWECDQLEPGELLQENELLYVYYLHYWVKEVTRRVMEIGLEIYAGLGCQKDLPFERWMRLVLLGQHTGSTGTFNLIKSARMIEKMQKMQK